jgi:adenine-specific DNA methylase
VTDHKHLEDIHKESLQTPKANQLVPVQPSGRAFEGVRTPLNVQEFYDEVVRMTEQHRPDARSISIQQGVGFQKSTLLGSLYKPSGQHSNTSGRYPAFQNIPVFSSNATRSYSEDRLDAQSSHPNLDLINIKLRCF